MKGLKSKKSTTSGTVEGEAQGKISLAIEHQLKMTIIRLAITF